MNRLGDRLAGKEWHLRDWIDRFREYCGLEVIERDDDREATDRDFSKVPRSFVSDEEEIREMRIEIHSQIDASNGVSSWYNSLKSIPRMETEIAIF
jgi:hypothetical protein